jgi:hypothetical protein
VTLFAAVIYRGLEGDKKSNEVKERWAPPPECFGKWEI